VLALHLDTKSFRIIGLRLPYATPSLLWELSGYVARRAPEPGLLGRGVLTVSKVSPYSPVSAESCSHTFIESEAEVFGDSNSSIAESNRSMKSTAAVGVT